MTRLEKLKSLCADNGITGYVSSLRKSELFALLALVEQIVFLNQMAINFSKNYPHAGTTKYIGFANKALTAFAAWNNQQDDVS